jgi:hypothetical protein
MIKMMTAFTTEVDIAEVAVSQILAGLDTAALRENCIALVHCHSEFVETGVLEAVCRALPCESAGITSSLPAVKGTSAQLALTVTLLTSDKCTFKVAEFDATARESVYPHITEAAKTLIKHDGSRDIYPSMVFSYISFMSFASGDISVKTLAAALPGVPLYGSLPVSDNMDFTQSYTIRNGVCSEHGGSFVAVYGDIKPTFRLTSVREGNVFNTGGRVDKCDGNLLFTIDGMNAWDYIVSKGVTTKETYRNILGQPMIFKYPDGSQTMRNCLNVNFDNGSLILAGDVYEGALVDFAMISADDIRRSTTGLAAEIESAVKDSSVVFIYSCATRLWTLGANMTDEIDIISKILKNKKFSFAYSGGEIVPLTVDGKYVNTFQNNNLTVLTL